MQFGCLGDVPGALLDTLVSAHALTARDVAA